MVDDTIHNRIYKSSNNNYRTKREKKEENNIPCAPAFIVFYKHFHARKLAMAFKGL